MHDRNIAALAPSGTLLALLAIFVGPGCGRGPGPSALANDESPTPSKVTVHARPTRLPAGARTHDWASFLGPTHNAVAAETGILEAWPEDGPKLVWELEAGAGYASPAIRAHRLVTFHRVGDQERIECRNAETGESYWTFGYPTAYVDRYDFSNGPRSSPVIDEGRVFVHGAEGKLHCLDLKTGALIWQRDTSREFDVPQDFFGVGSTPLVWRDLLIVQLGAPQGPSVVALDKATGETRWQAGKGWTAGYASPIPGLVHGKQRIFAFLGGDSDPPVGGLLVLDPASGTVDFQFPFRSRTYTSVNVSSPVIARNHVLISSSYHSGAVLLRLKQGGGYEEAWRTRAFGAHFMTPIFKDGYLYGISGSGKGDTALVCLDWATGELKWRHAPRWVETVERNGQREEVAFSSYLGSLLQVGERFLLLGELGHLAWVELTPNGYRELQRTRLFNASETWCAPLLSRGLLYVCQNRMDAVTRKGPRLLCYDLRATR